MRNNTARVYRQGDVLVKEIGNEDAIFYTTHMKGSKITTLEISGETGQKHRISGHVSANSSGTLLLLEESGTMTHPQHEPLNLPEGLYQVYRTREYDEERERESGD